MTTHRRPGKIISRNGGLSEFKNHRQGIAAFFRPFLRRGLDVTEFRAQSHSDGTFASCTLVLGDDIVGNAEINSGSFGLRITITPRSGEKQYGKHWKREWRKARRTHKSRRRPKLRKFGAYVASEIMKRYQDYAVKETMES